MVLDLFARFRHAVDPHRLRRDLTRRRRTVAAVLAGLGVFFIIASLRPSSPTLVADAPPDAVLTADQVAVPVLVRPAAVASALTPGMTIDVIDPESPDIPIAQSARVLRLPSSGFGPTAEAVVVLAVPETDGKALASHASTGVGVIIRSAS